MVKRFKIREIIVAFIVVFCSIQFCLSKECSKEEIENNIEWVVCPYTGEPINRGDEFSILLKKAKKPEVLILPEGKEVTIHYGDNILYFTKSQKDSFYFFLEYEENTIEENRYIEILGTKKEIKYSSNSPEIATVDKNGRIHFKQSGKVIFKISIDGISILIPIQGIQLPINIGEKAETIIQKLGPPDEKIKQLLMWPDGDFVDNLFYDTTLSGKNLIIEHFTYKKYPEIVLTLKNGELINLKNIKWENLNLYKRRSSTQ